MNNSRNREYADLSVEELRAELLRLKDVLCDLKDVHEFTFGRTSVHIGAEQAENMQREHEAECDEIAGRIAQVEGLLRAKGGA